MHLAIPSWKEQIDRSVLDVPVTILSSSQLTSLRHIFPGQIRFALYHGSLRAHIEKSLVEYDIVLTTYGTLQAEWKSRNEESPLYSNTWARVVLDEGQIYYSAQHWSHIPANKAQPITSENGQHRHSRLQQH